MKSPFLRRFGMPSPFFDNEAGFSPTVLLTGSTAFLWYDPSDVANTNWRRNLLTWTEQFDNAAWVKGNSVVTANAAVAPDGTTTADLLYPSTTGSDRRVISASLALSTSAHTVSAYIKAAGKSWAYMLVPQANTINDVVWFDLANGVVGTTGSAATSASIQSVGNGWYRCAVTGLADATSFYSINVADGNGSTSVTANGTDGILIWGAQLEVGSVATEYQRITDVNTEVIQRFPTATLYQDAAGTTPVTAPAQPVGLVLDKSQGLVLGPELRTATTVVSGAWTQAGGVVTAPGTSGAADNVSYTLSAATVAGRFYEVAIPNTMPGGSFYVDFGSGTGSQVGALGSSTQRIILTCTASGSVVRVGRWTGSPTGTIGPISVRELPGFHATQATAASRPTYGIVPRTGRRNLLTWSEDLSNSAGWTVNAGIASVTNQSVTGPGGTTVTAQRIAFSTTTGIIAQGSIPATQLVGSFWVKTVSGTTQIRPSVLATAGSAQTVTETWARLSVGNAAGIRFSIQSGSTLSSDILVYAAQLEVGSTATAYQRVGSQFDVTEAGVASLSYLSFDGVDDFLVTPTITPNADKVQVFAGVRKLSDVSGNMLIEHSASVTANNGSFYIIAPSGAGLANYVIVSKGTLSAGVNAAGFAAPITNILTGLADISGDSAILRVNGVQRAITTTDQGTGNYLAYPLYIGRRGGTLLPFNGQLYGLITRFSTANLDAGTITSTETWVAGKTGVTLA